MRKVTYKINDYEYFRSLFLMENPSIRDENLAEILNRVDTFAAVYILYGEPGHVAEYAFLYDEEGQKLNMEKLNGYQRGVIIGDCNRHFEGRPMSFGGGNKPCGVVSITEEEVDEGDIHKRISGKECG